MAHARHIWSPSWPVCSVCHAGYVGGLGNWSQVTTGDGTFASLALSHLLNPGFLHLTWVKIGLGRLFFAYSIRWKCREQHQLFTTKLLPNGSFTPQKSKFDNDWSQSSAWRLQPVQHNKVAEKRMGTQRYRADFIKFTKGGTTLMIDQVFNTH